MVFPGWEKGRSDKTPFKMLFFSLCDEKFINKTFIYFLTFRFKKKKKNHRKKESKTLFQNTPPHKDLDLLHWKIYQKYKSNSNAT